jgi:hypothetical protein
MADDASSSKAARNVGDVYDHPGEGGPAGLSLNADRRDRSGQPQDLMLGKSYLLAGTSDAQCHVDDLRFCGRHVVAERDDG